MKRPAEDPPAHPLFPADSEEEDPPEVLQIHVRRDGKTYPRPFGPEELTSLEQIHALWGGGTYELIARNERHITRKYAVVIPGRSKTFVPDDDEAPEALPAPSVVPTIAAPHGAADAFTAVLPFMQLMMQMTMQQSQQQSQMLIALMTSGREQSQQHLQQMQMMHDRSMQQQMQMMQTMIESQKGSRPDELILRGIELAGQLHGGGESDGGEASELGELAEAAASIMQGVQGFAGLGPQQPQQPPNGASQPPGGPVQ